MADNNKAIYGRKIFFVNPSFSLESTIIDRLRTMEYEVYIIQDYKNAISILANNADSICFFSPDSQLSIQGWKAFLRTIALDERFAFLNCGIITKGFDKKEETEFQDELDFEAGFFKMNKDMEELLREIVKVLDTLEAKGLRKYVRAYCLDDKTAELFWMEKDRMHKLKMIDISSVGIAAVLPAKSLNLVQPNQILKSVKLMINGKQIPVTLKVFAIKSTGVDFTLVLMNELETSIESVAEIRKYVAEKLQRKIDQDAESVSPDKTDYEQLAKLELQAKKMAENKKD